MAAGWGEGELLSSRVELRWCCHGAVLGRAVAQWLGWKGERSLENGMFGNDTRGNRPELIMAACLISSWGRRCPFTKCTLASTNCRPCL